MSPGKSYFEKPAKAVTTYSWAAPISIVHMSGEKKPPARRAGRGKLSPKTLNIHRDVG